MLEDAKDGRQEEDRVKAQLGMSMIRFQMVYRELHKNGSA
jgi:hypothetical protein